jgi:hypothetical protein
LAQILKLIRNFNFINSTQMKKLVFTIAAVAAFSFANAQELQQPQETPTKKGTATTDKKETATKKEAQAGTVTTDKAEKNPNAGSGTTVEPKKSGTRMAINEKGLPGEKKSTSGTTKAATNSNPK